MDEYGAVVAARKACRICVERSLGKIGSCAELDLMEGSGREPFYCRPCLNARKRAQQAATEPGGWEAQPDAKNAKAVFGVVEGDALDKACQNLPGRRFQLGLWRAVHEVPRSAS